MSGRRTPRPGGDRRRVSTGAIRPASTMVEVKALIDPEMLVEIEVDALPPDSGSGAKKE